MTDPKEFESLDQLFRKTFEELPETPAATGWDTPSERVWQHVQSQIKPPRTGWSTQTIALLAAFAVTLTLGLYLIFGRAGKMETPAVESPVAKEQPALLPESESEVPENQALVAEKPETSLKELKKKAAGTVKKNTDINIPQTSPGQAAKSDVGESVSKLPVETSGRKPVSPNSTERRKAELARRAEIAWKTPIAPLSPHWPDINPKHPRQ